jgi:microcystin degradation protein MlrC
VHYRADFEPLAASVIEAATPGSFLCDATQIPYQNLRSGIRIEPGGTTFTRSKGI